MSIFFNRYGEWIRWIVIMLGIGTLNFLHGNFATKSDLNGVRDEIKIELNEVKGAVVDVKYALAAHVSENAILHQRAEKTLDDHEARIRRVETPK